MFSGCLFFLTASFVKRSFATLICFNQTFMFLLFQHNYQFLLHLLLINPIYTDCNRQYCNKKKHQTNITHQKQQQRFKMHNTSKNPPTNSTILVHTRHVLMIEIEFEIITNEFVDLSPEALEREERGEAKGTFLCCCYS